MVINITKLKNFAPPEDDPGEVEESHPLVTFHELFEASPGSSGCRDQAANSTRPFRITSFVPPPSCTLAMTSLAQS